MEAAAILAASSVRREDLVFCERRHADRVGSIYQLAHHPAQRWRWFPELRRDEAIVFVVYDSDPARVGVTPHASFENPLAPPDAPPRRSLEVRTFAFF
ncbi:MAG: CmcJ/NvfI family oxidoreductase [Myxococcota bacterium]|nr:CmcJ/NvfI family oxidoreductase [Myxococcota bacterium]